MNGIGHNKKSNKNNARQRKMALWDETVLYFLLVFAACFWWYGETGNEIGLFGGALSVGVLWVYTFNKLPLIGLECIKHPRALYLQLPLSVVATIGFLISVYIT